MILVIDIGNTNITLGLYDGDLLVANYRLTTWFKRTSDEYGFMIMNFITHENIAITAISGVIISSVVPKIMHSFTNSIRKYLNHEPLLVGPGLKTGISIKTDNPRELGADRLVNAVGAHTYYGGDALVIDFGTATTFDYVGRDAIFQGGVITAGLEITAQSLAARTAKLPEIEIKPSHTICAKNTIQSMQAGIFYGYLGQTEYIIRKFKEDVNPDLKVIATGGLGKIIFEHTQEIDIYDPELTFKGLKLIYHKNNP